MSLNELLVTRMCHDLAGSIGTISNTSELLEMDPSFVKDGAKLLKTSSRVLVSRLKFFRALLGDKTEISPEIVLNYLDSLPVSMSLEGIISSKEHLMFVLFGVDVLTQGGLIEIRDDGFIFSGDALFFNDRQKEILLNHFVDKNPKYVVPMWISRWLQERKMKIEILQNQDVLSFHFLSETL